MTLNSTFYCMAKLKKLINFYCDLFDRETTNSTIVVWAIWLLIMSAWIAFQPANQSSIKGSLIEFNSQSDFNRENIVFVWWKQYKLIFQEIK